MSLLLKKRSLQCQDKKKMTTERDLDSQSGSNTDLEDDYPSKKIKLRHQLINTKISKYHSDIDIHEHEVYNFFFIFNELLTISLSEDTSSLDSEYSQISLQ